MKQQICATLALSLVASFVSADVPDAAKHHAALGIQAAEEYPGYASLCDLSASIRNVNAPPASKARKTRETRRNGERREPKRIPATQVFDNLWFLGTAGTTAWLYGTEDGFILIDALETDARAQTYILDGMRQAGLDPQAIRAVLVTHGHGDHYGGADYIAKALNVPILMTPEDWDLVATLGPHPRFGPPPPRGQEVFDGQILQAGESQLTIHVTPGHTPGTISPVFMVYDHGEAHVAMIWGGTGFNFGTVVPTFRTYAASAERMRDIARERGVDVFLSGHPKRDGTVERLEALIGRTDTAPHPFVRGEAGYALFDVLEQCALAQAARFER